MFVCQQDDGNTVSFIMINTIAIVIINIICDVLVISDFVSMPE